MARTGSVTKGAGGVVGTLPVASGGTSQSSFTKGDLLAAAASTTLNKLAVGSNGQVLTADSASTNGVKWAAAGGGGGGSGTHRFLVYLSADQITTSGYQKINFDTAEFDATAGFDITTNHRFTASAAMVLHVGAVVIEPGNGQVTIITIYKNGTEDKRLSMNVNIVGDGSSTLISLAPNDYIELWYENPGSNRVYGGDTVGGTYFWGYSINV